MMTFSYIEIVMLMGFGYSLYAILEKRGVERLLGIICVVCNILVLGNKFWGSL
jgi:hypothetical protein